MSGFGFGLSKEQEQLVALLVMQQGIALGDDTAAKLQVDLERRHDPFPLTEVQEAYYLGRSGHFELGNIACQGYEELDVIDLDVARYEDAWNRMIARHDMLRAIVKPDGTQVIQRDVPRFRIPITDLRQMTSEARERALQEIRAAMSHRVGDPHRWPLLAVRVSLIDDRRARIHWNADALLLDGSSGLLLDGELRRFYEDSSFAPPPLALSFRDYVLYLRAEQDTDAWRASERYWKDRAATLPPAPDLPLRSRSADISRPRFARWQHRLDAAAWARLKQCCKELGATSSVLVLAAFAETLRRFGQRRDFTINLTLFDRQLLHSDVSRIIGDFTSTLLVEVRDNGATFEDRLSTLQESFLRDLDHRRVSGMHALRHYAHTHRQVGAALMPVVFTSLLGTGGTDRHSALPGHLGQPTYAITQTPQVLLDHQLHEEGGALVLIWDAVEDAFLPGALDAMFAAYTGLLDRLAADPTTAWRETRPVGLPAEHADERRRFNATEAATSSDLLHAGFLRMAAQQPSREAVIDADRRISYGELAERATWLAERLLVHDIAPGELVAIVMERGWEQVVAVLAILEAGGAYVPIDATLPEARIAALSDASRARVVLTQSGVAKRLTLHSRIAVETVDDAGRSAPSHHAPRQRPEDIAYVIYTSGSTGMPKGVAIEHRSVVNTIEDINVSFDVGQHDRVFGISSLSFDLSVYDIFGTLAAGACLVLPARGHDKDPEHWLALLRRERVTIWNSVPALLQMLANYAEDRCVLEQLRLALLSGDWIPLDLPGRVHKLAPSACVISLGGATEASIWSIVHPITNSHADWTSVPYGRPMRNQRWFVLDERLEECPDGVTGELHIGGIGIARGYWDDAEKTAERFVIWPATGERLYRTGDLGRMREGLIELLGRKDHQVKVGGHRIELGEIEVTLAQHAAVKEAVVAAQGDARDSRKQLVAYVVLHAGGAVSEAQLKQHARERLPEHMIPRRIRTLDALPLTANGKVDRNALPKADIEDVVGCDHIAPRSDLERKISEVVAEKLKLARISVTSRFLDLGATSLVLVEVHKVLEARLGREIPVLDMFQRGSVADLASSLGDAPGKGDLLSEARMQGQRRRQQRDRGRARTQNTNDEGEGTP